MRPRRPAVALALVVGAAVLLRVVWVFWAADVVFPDKAAAFDAGDTAYYLRLAHSILADGQFASNGDPTAFVMPLYPIFLAGVFRLFGQHLVAVQLVQIALSALTLLWVYGIARRVFEERAALAAAALGGGHLYLVHWSGFVLTDTLFVFLMTAGVYALVRLDQARRPGWAALTGLLAGLAALCRSVAVGAFAALGAVWLARGFGQRRAWALLAVLGLTAALVMAPWAVRNHLEFDAFIPTTNQFGSVLFRGNNANAQWLYGEPAPGEVPRLDAEGLTPAQVDARFRQMAFDFIAENPGRFMGLVARRLYLYWSPDFPTYSLKHNLVNAAIYLPLYALMGLGLAVLWRRRPGYAWLFLTLFVYFSALHALTIVDWDQRYRLPLQPFIVILAGGGLVWLARAARRWAVKP